MATTTATLQAASEAERDAAWRETPAGERMQAWRDRMNAFLAPYTTDPTRQAGRTFLQKILRGDRETPLSAVEVSAEALYRIFIQDGKGEVECFARRIVTTNTREEIERHQALILQLAKMYGEQTSREALALIYALKQPTAEPPYALLGTDDKTGREIALSQRERLQGLYIIGSTGTGKTTLLHHLILSDIRAGLGVCLIEPHGDLTNAIIATIPDERRDDIVYLDLTDSHSPFGLNLFQCDSPHNATEVAKVASFVMHVFEKVWNVGTSTPQLAQVLRNITRTLI
jgi:Type IV secretion-system coupling protein DNA-binding domain